MTGIYDERQRDARIAGQPLALVMGIIVVWIWLRASTPELELPAADGLPLASPTEAGVSSLARRFDAFDRSNDALTPGQANRTPNRSTVRHRAFPTSHGRLSSAEAAPAISWVVGRRLSRSDIPRRPIGIETIAPSSAPRADLAAAGPGPVALSAPPSQRRKWSIYGWLLARPGGNGTATGLVSRYGASQLGAVVEYRFAGERDPSAYLRANRALVARGEAEIAAGLRFYIKPIPLAIHVERRIAANAAGRNAFALFASGGFDSGDRSRLAFEAYGQAGIVGFKRRTPFADASLVALRRVLGSDTASVSIGAGSWAGAQPNATRVDVGPRIEADVARGSGRLRMALDWRQRVAGSASPGSGPALSVSASF